MDQIVLKRQGQEVQAEGRLLVRAQDGGVALMDRGGVIWMVEAKDLMKHTHDVTPFAPYDSKSLAARMWPSCPTASPISRPRIT